jgi:pilus assembly protein Flp/PilA
MVLKKPSSFIGAVAEGIGPREEVVVHKCLRSFFRFLRREDGPTSVEYAVLLALVISVCMGAVTKVGNRTSKQFNNVSKSLKVKKKK